MGGTIQCDGSGDGNNMDGHKYVCMDSDLMLTGPRSSAEGCLTLSFGAYYETSFDEVVLELPCQVHMFDVLDFDPWITKVDPRASFDKEGLAGSHRTNVYANAGNAFAEVYTLGEIVTNHNLTGRLIHVLKVDIENGEWEAFANIAKDPLFDAVGQIALEVHALEVVEGLRASWSQSVPKEKWLKTVQEKYQILRDIENRGFRRVVYWDNYQSKYPYFDDDGVRYETSGEMLYVNTNWYDSAFMRKLANRGYNVPIDKQYRRNTA